MWVLFIWRTSCLTRESRQLKLVTLTSLLVVVKKESRTGRVGKDQPDQHARAARVSIEKRTPRYISQQKRGDWGYTVTDIVSKRSPRTLCQEDDVLPKSRWILEYLESSSELRDGCRSPREIHLSDNRHVAGVPKTSFITLLGRRREIQRESKRNPSFLRLEVPGTSEFQGNFSKSQRYQSFSVPAKSAEIRNDFRSPRETQGKFPREFHLSRPRDIQRESMRNSIVIFCLEFSGLSKSQRNPTASQSNPGNSEWFSKPQRNSREFKRNRAEVQETTSISLPRSLRIVEVPEKSFRVLEKPSEIWDEYRSPREIFGSS